jgi:hypothetical protein
MKTSRVTLFGSILFLGFILISCKKEGCTDPLAINYSSSANHDNGTCEYDATGGSGGAQTVIDSDITTPTTLSGTVSVCGGIDIQAALTLEQGTILNMCAGSSMHVTATGSLSSLGTAQEPVIIRGEQTSQGYWDGIRVSSNNPNNLLQYTTISDAGGYWVFGDAAIYLEDQAQMSLTNTTVTNSAGSGMVVNETSTISNFSNNTFSNNAAYGIDITARQVGSLDNGTNYNSNNSLDFINVRAATVNTAQTWSNLGEPYLFNGTSDITAAVTVAPGTNIKFEASAGILVTTGGSFSAVGTQGTPIIFEGRFSTPGYWRAIDFESNNPNNQLQYVNISDGGQYWVNGYASVQTSSGGRLEIDNTTITNSNSWGMYVDASTTVVSSGSNQTDAAGVLMSNTMTGNGVGPDANCSGGGCTVFFD